MGHNFGLYHASVSDPWTAVWTEYGDMGDIMGEFFLYLITSA